MTKFNRPIPPRAPDTRTAEGGVGFSRDPKDELFLLGVANMVGVDTFYESAEVRDKRFTDLIHAVTKVDAGWVANFIGWLRSEANMRSAPIVAAAEYVRAGGPGGRQLVASVLQRPDEPAEMVGYWFHTHGRNLPMPVKRGIADALGRLYTEKSVLRYDGAGQAIRFGDVVELTHPKPKAARQGALYRHLIDRRHGRSEVPPPVLATLAQDDALTHLGAEVRRDHLGDAIKAGWSWERLSGWLPGGWDAAAWEAVIPNMGLMALTRNLRNFDKAGISQQAVMAVTQRFMDPEEVRRSRQFPLRFLTAWKAVSSIRWGLALESALNHSLANVPALPGRTLVLVDVSPSMRDPALSSRTDGRADPSITPRRWEVAAVFGAAIAQRASSADVVLFDFNPVAQASVSGADSVLRFAEQCGEWANKSNGTDILRALAESYRGHDRVVILTDEQHGYQPSRIRYSYWPDRGGAGVERLGWHDVADIRCPVYTFNLGGHAVGVTPNERNWHTVGGLTDNCFKLIPLLEARRGGLWPWDVAELTAKYGTPVADVIPED